MPKELLILRHAEAAPAPPGGRDVERPLTPAGRELALRLGQDLRRRDLLPDLVLCSTARRTRSTLEHVRQGADWTGPVLFLDIIYHGGTADFSRSLGGLTEAHARVLFIGHNPGVSEMASRLSTRTIHMHPASLVQLLLDIDSWEEFSLDSSAKLGLVRSAHDAVVNPS